MINQKHGKKQACVMELGGDDVHGETDVRPKIYNYLTVDFLRKKMSNHVISVLR